jgi:hypothetical protein
MTLKLGPFQTSITHLDLMAGMARDAYQGFVENIVEANLMEG